jgi:hypothetical protein
MALLKKFCTLMIATSISAGAFSFPITSVLAEQVTYTCQLINDTPTTVFRRGNKERQMISWVRSFGGSYTPERRCKEVTERLNQNVSSRGRFLTHGIKNQQPIICFTDRTGGGCNSLFFTLKRGDNAKEKLKNLFALNQGNYSSDSPLREGACSLYIDIDAITNGKKEIAEVVCSQS